MVHHYNVWLISVPIGFSEPSSLNENQLILTGEEPIEIKENLDKYTILVKS